MEQGQSLFFVPVHLFPQCRHHKPQENTKRNCHYCTPYDTNAITPGDGPAQPAAR